MVYEVHPKRGDASEVNKYETAAAEASAMAVAKSEAGAREDRDVVAKAMAGIGFNS